MKHLTWKDRLAIWLNSPTVTSQTKIELKGWTAQKQQRAFQNSIQMKNSGWRRPIAIGSDTFNLYTIKQIAITWFKQVARQYPGQPILVLADQRHQSQLAKQICLNAANYFGLQPFTTLTDDQFAPTPFLTYLLKNYNFHAAIMITASHCEANFNGCKIFTNKGLGLPTADINKLIFQINQEYEELLNFELPVCQPQFLSGDYKKKYFKTITKFTNQFAFKSKTVPLFFSALHGVTTNWTDQFLRMIGFNVTVFQEQNDFDSNFGTIVAPNPEIIENFTHFMQKIHNQTISTGALMILNDCDGDRVRLACKQNQQWKLLHGNEIATCIVYFLLNELKRKGKIYRTWVSSSIIDIIAQHFHQSLITTETGPINLASAYSKNPQTFLFAFEESLGYLPSLDVNVYKDGILTACVLAEIANYLQNKYQLTLWDYLQQIYQKFNYYCYDQIRFNYNAKLGLKTVVEYLQNIKDYANYSVRKFIFLPNSRQIRLILMYFDDQNWIALRFSDTESIFKVYFVISATTKNAAKLKLTKIKQAFLLKIDKITMLNQK